MYTISQVFPLIFSLGISFCDSPIIEMGQGYLERWYKTGVKPNAYGAYFSKRPKCPSVESLVKSSVPETVLWSISAEDSFCCDSSE